MDPAVEVDRDAEVFAAGLADRRDAFQNGVDLIIGIDHLQFFGRIHLDRGKAGVLLFERRRAGV